MAGCAPPSCIAETIKRRRSSRLMGSFFSSTLDKATASTANKQEDWSVPLALHDSARVIFGLAIVATLGVAAAVSTSCSIHVRREMRHSLGCDPARNHSAPRAAGAAWVSSNGTGTDNSTTTDTSTATDNMMFCSAASYATSLAIGNQSLLSSSDGIARFVFVSYGATWTGCEYPDDALAEDACDPLDLGRFNWLLLLFDASNVACGAADNTSGTSTGWQEQSNLPCRRQRRAGAAAGDGDGGDESEPVDSTFIYWQMLPGITNAHKELVSDECMASFVPWSKFIKATLEVLAVHTLVEIAFTLLRALDLRALKQDVAGAVVVADEAVDTIDDGADSNKNDLTAVKQMGQYKEDLSKFKGLARVVGFTAALQATVLKDSHLLLRLARIGACLYLVLIAFVESSAIWTFKDSLLPLRPTRFLCSQQAVPLSDPLNSNVSSAGVQPPRGAVDAAAPFTCVFLWCEHSRDAIP